MNERYEGSIIGAEIIFLEAEYNEWFMKPEYERFCHYFGRIEIQ